MQKINKPIRFKVLMVHGEEDVIGEDIGKGLALAMSPIGDWWVFTVKHKSPLPFARSFDTEKKARDFIRCIRHLPWEDIALDIVTRETFLKSFWGECEFARKAVEDVASHQDPEIRFKLYMHRLHKRRDLMDYLIGK